jgi:hypothetical protein
VPQAAHRAETIAFQSVRYIARCFISDILEIPMIEPSLMIDLRNVCLGLPLFLLSDGNQNKDKDCCRSVFLCIESVDLWINHPLS